MVIIHEIQDNDDDSGSSLEVLPVTRNLEPTLGVYLVLKTTYPLPICTSQKAKPAFRLRQESREDKAYGADVLIRNAQF
ncbi:hypothetical protein RJT34_19875 [Clitoria ternatea]|uniref:Uncharacterized protein n=1 Tax=Clitoria ternatea TaxID=43366 RepID=A0AAN9IRU6_CLITE